MYQRYHEWTQNGESVKCSLRGRLEFFLLYNCLTTINAPFKNEIVTTLKKSIYVYWQYYAKIIFISKIFGSKSNLKSKYLHRHLRTVYLMFSDRFRRCRDW